MNATLKKGDDPNTNFIRRLLATLIEKNGGSVSFQGRDLHKDQGPTFLLERSFSSDTITITVMEKKDV